MSRELRIGISPCPNDTFVFHALLTGRVRPRGFDVAIEFHDVQTLNEKLLAGELDAGKASFHAALKLAQEVVVLSAGSALGFGAGPLLLKRKDAPPLTPEPRSGESSSVARTTAARVLCPGEWTTAHLLYRLFHARDGRVEQAVFSAIMPALERGAADYGVCIHEGRFTYRERGLELVEDLGETWERATRSPLPLGGILARKRLGRNTLHGLDTAIRDSLDDARAHPEEAFATMRQHAQELDERVIWAHVDLYVNAFTRDLGHEGREALRVLAARAREVGLVGSEASELEVLASPG